MQKGTRLKEFGRHVYLTFKVWRMVLISVLALSILPGTLIFFLPSIVRVAYAVIFVALTEVMTFLVARFITGSVAQQINIVLYDRKHKPEKRFYPAVKEMAEKMGMTGYDKPVEVTDNPSIKGPFVNLFSGTIKLPSFYEKKYPMSEINAAFGHELAHLKYKKTFAMELTFVSLGVILFSLVLALFTIYIISIVAEIALLMLGFSYVMRRNERRADMEGAKVARPESMISLLQQLRSESKNDDGSETHPSFTERINRLRPLLDSES